MEAPTSDERREVAEELRNYMRLRSSDTFEAFYTRLNGVLFGDDGFDRPDSDVFECLAGLIDPTCQVSSVEAYCDELGQLDGWEFHLTCGHSFEQPWNEPPSYCPECGARVVERGEG